MRLKITYSETIERKAEVTVNDTEFLEWLNQPPMGPSYKSLDEARKDLGDAGVAGLAQEFLEAGPTSDWATDQDPRANTYDQRLLSAEVA